MKIYIIAAVASNGVIGNGGKIPWHLSADLKKFQSITMGAPILMGRKTHQSIGKPLPGRQNIVISTNPNYQSHGCVIFSNIQAALASYQKHPKIFVIGGASIYEALLPLAHGLYITEIAKEFRGDIFFPAIDQNLWQAKTSQTVGDDASVDFSYSFVEYQKITKPAGNLF